MIFKRQRKNKKAQTVRIIIMLVVGLVVVGILIYMGYKYILGTGKSVGALGSCKGQGGSCEASCDAKTHESFFGMGCEEPKPYCCILKSRFKG